MLNNRPDISAFFGSSAMVSRCAMWATTYPLLSTFYHLSTHKCGGHRAHFGFFERIYSQGMRTAHKFMFLHSVEGKYEPLFCMCSLIKMEDDAVGVPMSPVGEMGCISRVAIISPSFEGGGGGI